MEYRVMIQSTPNPNALKFIVNTPVKTAGNVTYKRGDDCAGNTIAARLFELPHVAEVYFFDNYITVTQDGQADWDDLEDKIKEAVLGNIADHNPDFTVKQPEKPPAPKKTSPEMVRIDAILDETVRPALQMDGGDLQVVDYADNVLRIFYQGACGSCPSATMGTMKAIENLLKDEFNPDIVVELADPTF